MASPLKNAIKKHNMPIDAPKDIPNQVALLARRGRFAPVFCETKTAMACIKVPGTSIIKLMIFWATPYPEDAARPKLLIMAQMSRKDILVSADWSVKGSPNLQNSFISILNLISFNLMDNSDGCALMTNSENTTLKA